MQLQIVTFRDRYPSKHWELNVDLVSRFKVFDGIEDMLNDTKIVLDNVCDESFKWVMSILQKDDMDARVEINSLSMDMLFRVFKVCDYLQIEDLHVKCGQSIANRLNKMTMQELENTFKVLFN